MNRHQELTLLLLLFLFNSCTTSEGLEPSEVVQPTQSENVYDEFNRWVYGQMNGQYLWREDLPDSLECDYDLPPAEFFKSLLSGKDRFSYFTSNPHFKKPKSIGSTKRLGFEYQEVQDAQGNQWLYVLYVYDTQAKAKGIRRGDILKELSGDIYRKAFIREGKIQGLEPNEIKLAIDIGNEKNSVLLDSIYHLGGKSIGYLCYLQYDDVDDLIKPIKKFADSNIDELILDLRYNPGGYVSTCKYLCNCIVPSENYGKIFQVCSYNNRLAKENLLKTGDEHTYSYFQDLPRPGEEILGEPTVIPLNLKQLTVITSSHTASASEATIVCLRPYIQITSIGEQTVGKGVGSWLIYSPKYKYAIQPITMRYYNSLMETTPDEGLTPDFYMKDGYAVSKKEIGDADETLLNAALASILSQNVMRHTSQRHNIKRELSLTPVGEPSYVTEFKNKHYYEND